MRIDLAKGRGDGLSGAAGNSRFFSGRRFKIIKEHIDLNSQEINGADTGWKQQRR
jgi:hypothetical protein